MRASAVCGLLALLVASCDSGGSSPPGSADAGPINAQLPPLPDACIMLQGIDLTARLTNGPVEFIPHTPPRAEGITLTSCDAVPEGAYLGISLMVRQQINSSYRNEAPERASDVAKSLQASGIPTQTAEVGDAAFWAEDIRQLHIFYRRGAAYLIITTRGETAKDDALAIGAALLEAYP